MIQISPQIGDPTGNSDSWEAQKVHSNNGGVGTAAAARQTPVVEVGDARLCSPARRRAATRRVLQRGNGDRVVAASPSIAFSLAPSDLRRLSSFDVRGEEELRHGEAQLFCVFGFLTSPNILVLLRMSRREMGGGRRSQLSDTRLSSDVSRPDRLAPKKPSVLDAKTWDRSELTRLILDRTTLTGADYTTKQPIKHQKIAKKHVIETDWASAGYVGAQQLSPSVEI
ncbi:unnamed protein product [Caenorhabditis auriculariae]|uniref:Uncharacterized protein n=1 Tax=Caenorhabditis auriculariae TaxID=2777116 RepID=A0A8S1HKL2_9PELO|nr:unnamed protein product [Caenorhabditis auriculariae]